MYVIDVIPLSRTAPGVLSYRSKGELAPGTVVNITVRKTATQGIVLASTPVTEAKEMLKSARFLLSRSVPAPAGSLPPAYLEAVGTTADYHAVTPGAVLAAMFAEYARLDAPLPLGTLEDGTGFVQEALELPRGGRVAAYSMLIVANRAAGKATLLVVPTVAELLAWKGAFAELRPLVLSGTVAGARRLRALGEAFGHRSLIIATPSFSWVPVERLGTIIVERASAGTYAFPKRPHLSVVESLRALAEARQLPLTIGDFPLPLEYRPDPASSLPEGAPGAVLIDARRDPEKSEGTGPWRALPEPVIERIRAEVNAGGRAIVLATRKGYSTGVVCRDCGQAQSDERGMPLIFTTAAGKRAFTTSDGVARIDAARPCQRCGSWNLLPLGVGVERVEEELAEAFPDTHRDTLTAAELSSPRKAKAALAAAAAPGVITVGTEALLPWLYEADGNSERVPLGIIASADSLLSLPFWRARERFVRLAYMFSGVCRELLLVTRRPEDAAVDAVASPGSPRFWQEETALRRALSYPPFGTLMTLSVEGSPAAADRLIHGILQSLSVYGPMLMPERTGLGGKAVRTLALTIPQGAWPDQKLLGIVRSLPPTVRVRIDPESLW